VPYLCPFCAHILKIISNRSLESLSKSLYINDVIFKGGTSLSKAYKLIQRFSEDINLADLTSDKSDITQKMA